MKIEKGIPILNAKVDADQLSGVIARNALQTITESMVKMEKEGAKPEVMMDKCIWPILYEAERRFDSISKGDFDVPVDGFEYVVG